VTVTGFREFRFLGRPVLNCVILSLTLSGVIRLSLGTLKSLM